MQRTLFQELLPATARMKELEKENQLTFTGYRGLVVPLRIKPSAGSIERP